jgi:hypothetical protein
MIGRALGAFANGLVESITNVGIILSGGYTDRQYADVMLAEHRAAVARQRPRLATGGYVSPGVMPLIPLSGCLPPRNWAIPPTTLAAKAVIETDDTLDAFRHELTLAAINDTGPSWRPRRYYGFE